MTERDEIADLKRRLAEAQAFGKKSSQVGSEVFAKMTKERDEALAKLNHESYCHDKAVQTRDKALRERDEALATRDLLAIEALTSLSGAGIGTPEKGFTREPAELRHCINDLAKQRDEAVAEAASYREAINAPHEYSNRGNHLDTCRLCATLSQPGHGAALLERMRKLEALAEAVRVERLALARAEAMETMGDALEGVDKALAALEETP